MCGLDDQIKNNGKTFDSKEGCLARNDYEMSPNSFIYKIEWKNERLMRMIFSAAAVGICSDHYTQGSQDAAGSWIESLYYIGWNLRGCEDESTPHGLLCGGTEKSKNIFNQCKFIGDNLPQVTQGDIVGLIYDSINNELLFYLNGNKLNSKLTNIPTTKKLYWFAAYSGLDAKCTIVNTSVATR